MSGAGAPIAGVSVAGARIALVSSMWHVVIMDGLIAGAKRVCTQSEATATVIRASGSFELPILAKASALSGRFDAVVALGVIIRGDTPHFEYVCAAASAGLSEVALDTMIPVGFGLLTCDTEEQALARAGLEGSIEDKGAEATWAALTSLSALRALQGNASA
jgi:6,7-dimethyl-8-ribityllumazine synthase